MTVSQVGPMSAVGFSGFILLVSLHSACSPVGQTGASDRRGQRGSEAHGKGSGFKEEG